VRGARILAETHEYLRRVKTVVPFEDVALNALDEDLRVRLVEIDRVFQEIRKCHRASPAVRIGAEVAEFVR
jgi:hypothetical protein